MRFNVGIDPNGGLGVDPYAGKGVPLGVAPQGVSFGERDPVKRNVEIPAMTPAQARMAKARAARGKK